MVVSLDSKAAVAKIKASQKIAFLTGAGVSTPSGIPDYRSLNGIYHGLDAPEYLLSHDCLVAEPDKFYRFILNLYHPEAKPNVIHKKMAAMEQEKEVWVVSQNIDGLHEQAGSKHLVNFHGNLYHTYCRKCGQQVPYQDYLEADIHAGCGGQIRPDVVLYGEGFAEDVLTKAINAVAEAELIVIVGTTFQVHPFCDLLQYRKESAEIIAINQTPLAISAPFSMVQCPGETVFEEL